MIYKLLNFNLFTMSRYRYESQYRYEFYVNISHFQQRSHSNNRVLERVLDSALLSVVCALEPVARLL